MLWWRIKEERIKISLKTNNSKKNQTELKWISRKTCGSSLFACLFAVHLLAATSPIKNKNELPRTHNAELKQSVEKCQNEGEEQNNSKYEDRAQVSSGLSSVNSLRSHYFEMQHQQTSIKYDRREEMNVLQFHNFRSAIKISLPENNFLKIMDLRSICTILIALSTVLLWVFSSQTAITLDGVFKCIYFLR